MTEDSHRKIRTPLQQQWPPYVLLKHAGNFIRGLGRSLSVPWWKRRKDSETVSNVKV